MTECLANALIRVLERKDNLNAVVSALESVAPPFRKRKDRDSECMNWKIAELAYRC